MCNEGGGDGGLVGGVNVGFGEMGEGCRVGEGGM